MSRDRFATQVHNGWEDLDWKWLREVSGHARWLWVRVAGLSEVWFKNQDDPTVITWEGAASALTPIRATAAYLLIDFSFDPIRLGFRLPKAEAISQLRWEKSMVLHHRLGELLRLLREMQPHRIGLVV